MAVPVEGLLLLVAPGPTARAALCPADRSLLTSAPQDLGNCRTRVQVFEQTFEEVGVAVEELVDGAAAQLLAALEAVRQTPAPLGRAAARLAVLAHAAQELQGVYLRELSAVEPAAEGARSAADLLVDVAGLPVWQARADAALARRLGVLPGLLEAVAGGGVELSAARQLARAWAALPARLQDHATAQALITLGGLVDLPELKGKVDELVAALQPEVTDEAVAAAREAGGLLLTDVGAETRLQAHTDVLTGEWLREVLEAKAEADRGLLDGRTSDARLLDALLDIVRAAVGTPAVPGTDGADGGSPMLVVVATPQDLVSAGEAVCPQGDAVDAVPAEDALDDLLALLHPAGVGIPEGVPGSTSPGSTSPGSTGLGSTGLGSTGLGSTGLGSTGHRPRWSARTRAGTRLGPRTLLALCCAASLTRVLVGAAGHPVDSTPAARQLNRRDRRALELRAGYRCERLGCGRPARSCVPHHVVPWSRGGPSTLANTVLLCRSCHHLLHDRLRALTLTEERTIGPAGWVRGGPPGG